MFRLFGKEKLKRRRSASCPNLEAAGNAAGFSENKENYAGDSSDPDSGTEGKSTLSRLERIKAQRSIRRPKEREKRKEENAQKNQISMDDYLGKLTELKLWLKEEKHKHVDTLSSPKLKEYFKTFVRLWNKKKLPLKYYRACSVDTPETESDSTSVPVHEYTPPTRPTRNPDTPISLDLFPATVDLSRVSVDNEMISTDSPLSTFGKTSEDVLSSPAAVVQQMSNTPVSAGGSKTLPRQLSSSSLTRSLQRFATISRGPLVSQISGGDREELRIHPVSSPKCPTVLGTPKSFSLPRTAHPSAMFANRPVPDPPVRHESLTISSNTSTPGSSHSPAYAEVIDAIHPSKGSPQYAEIDESGGFRQPFSTPTEPNYCSINPIQQSPPYSELKKKLKGFNRRRSKSMEDIHSSHLKSYSPYRDNAHGYSSVRQNEQAPPLPERNYSPEKPHNGSFRHAESHQNHTTSKSPPNKEVWSPKYEEDPEYFKEKLKRSWLRFDSFLSKVHSPVRSPERTLHKKNNSPSHRVSPTKDTSPKTYVPKAPVMSPKSPLKRRSQEGMDEDSPNSTKKKPSPSKTASPNCNTLEVIRTPTKRRSQEAVENPTTLTSSVKKLRPTTLTNQTSLSSIQSEVSSVVEPSPKYSILTGSLNPTTRRKNISEDVVELEETSSESKEVRLSILQVKQLDESPKLPRRRLKRRSSSFSTTPGKGLVFGKSSKLSTSSPRRVSFAKDVKGEEGSGSRPVRRRSSRIGPGSPLYCKQSQERHQFETFLSAHVSPPRSVSPLRKFSPKNSPQKGSGTSPTSSPTTKNNSFSRMFNADSTSTKPSSPSKVASLAASFSPSKSNPFPNLHPSVTTTTKLNSYSTLSTFADTIPALENSRNLSPSKSALKTSSKAPQDKHLTKNSSFTKLLGFTKGSSQSSDNDNESISGKSTSSLKSQNSTASTKSFTKSPQKLIKVGEILFGIRAAQAKASEKGENELTSPHSSESRTQSSERGEYMSLTRNIHGGELVSSPSKRQDPSDSKTVFRTASQAPLDRFREPRPVSGSTSHVSNQAQVNENMTSGNQTRSPTKQSLQHGHHVESPDVDKITLQNTQRSSPNKGLSQFSAKKWISESKSSLQLPKPLNQVVSKLAPNICMYKANESEGYSSSEESTMSRDSLHSTKQFSELVSSGTFQRLPQPVPPSDNETFDLQEETSAWIDSEALPQDSQSTPDQPAVLNISDLPSPPKWMTDFRDESFNDSQQQHKEVKSPNKNVKATGMSGGYDNSDLLKTIDSSSQSFVSDKPESKMNTLTDLHNETEREKEFVDIELIHLEMSPGSRRKIFAMSPTKKGMQQRQDQHYGKSKAYQCQTSSDESTRQTINKNCQFEEQKGWKKEELHHQSEKKETEFGVEVDSSPKDQNKKESELHPKYRIEPCINLSSSLQHKAQTQSANRPHSYNNMPIYDAHTEEPFDQERDIPLENKSGTDITGSRFHENLHKDKNLTSQSKAEMSTSKTNLNAAAATFADKGAARSKMIENNAKVSSPQSSHNNSSSQSPNNLKRIESLRASPKVTDSNDSWITTRRKSSRGKKDSFRAVHNRYLLRSASRCEDDLNDLSTDEVSSPTTTTNSQESRLGNSSSDAISEEAGSQSSVDDMFVEKSTERTDGTEQKPNMTESLSKEHSSHISTNEMSKIKEVDIFTAQNALTNVSNSILQEEDESTSTQLQSQESHFAKLNCEANTVTAVETMESNSHSSLTPSTGGVHSDKGREPPPVSKKPVLPPSPLKKKPAVLPKPCKPSNAACQKLNVSKFVSSMPKRRSSLNRRESLSSGSDKSKENSPRKNVSVARRESNRKESILQTSTLGGNIKPFNFNLKMESSISKQDSPGLTAMRAANIVRRESSRRNNGVNNTSSRINNSSVIVKKTSTVRRESSRRDSLMKNNNTETSVVRSPVVKKTGIVRRESSRRDSLIKNNNTETSVMRSPVMKKTRIVRRESSRRSSSQQNTGSSARAAVKIPTTPVSQMNSSPASNSRDRSSRRVSQGRRRSSNVHLASFSERKKFFQQLQGGSSPSGKTPTLSSASLRRRESRASPALNVTRQAGTVSSPRFGLKVEDKMPDKQSPLTLSAASDLKV